ncbi:MAG: leucine-rich repeat domain-containing protein [Pseudanabaena sp. CRU_2_10]|nr:leucine-rich repeat domain-containing protein [Pseudanabaena sp. CRU_2_10]
MRINQTYSSLSWQNRIVDLKPLAGLTNLTNLELSSNQIADIKPLSGLTKVPSFDLSKREFDGVKR